MRLGRAASAFPCPAPVRAGERIEPENKQHLENTAAYLVRNPLSLRKLVYLDGERAVSTARG
jgi:hypothetical protein